MQSVHGSGGGVRNFCMGVGLGFLVMGSFFGFTILFNLLVTSSEFWFSLWLVLIAACFFWDLAFQKL